MIRLTLLLALISLGGCVSVPTDGTASVHTYVGIVRVAYPGSRGKLTAIDVKSLGLGYDGAAFLGWRDSKFVYAEPDDCRVVLIIRDRLESEHLERMVAALGDKACVADFSGSLAPH